MDKRFIVNRACLLKGCLFIVLLSAGCGRYGPPLPPEAFAPVAVLDLQISADLQGIKFTWTAPEKDARGKELESMNGYRIYRKEIKDESDILNRDIEYELLHEIEDTHIEVLDDLREKAKEEGKVARKVKVDRKLTEFAFTDITPRPGATYIYRIVPFNQGDVEGEVTQLIRVVYRGAASEVSLLNREALKSEGALF